MRARTKAVILALILVVVWSTAAPYLAKSLILEKELDKADAIIVLAGSSTYLERTKKAADIFQQGVSRRVILTDDGGFAGWSQEEQRNPPFVYLAKQELVKLGVPAQSIEIVKPAGSGTIYEARYIRSLISQRKWKSVELVTSGYHTRRALFTFQRTIQDKKVKVGIVGASTGDQTPSPFTWWLTPRGWMIVGGEYVKSIVYWIYY